jgi:hypothetical protein
MKDQDFEDFVNELKEKLDSMWECNVSLYPREERDVFEIINKLAEKYRGKK